MTFIYFGGRFGRLSLFRLVRCNVVGQTFYFVFKYFIHNRQVNKEKKKKKGGKSNKQYARKEVSASNCLERGTGYFDKFRSSTT